MYLNFVSCFVSNLNPNVIWFKFFNYSNPKAFKIKCSRSFQINEAFLFRKRMDRRRKEWRQSVVINVALMSSFNECFYHSLRRIREKKSSKYLPAKFKNKNVQSEIMFGLLEIGNFWLNCRLGEFCWCFSCCCSNDFLDCFRIQRTR